MRRLLALLLVLGPLCAAGPPARAQVSGVLQIDDPASRFLLRQQTAGRLPGAVLSHQPLSAFEALRLLDSLAADPAGMTTTDRWLLARFRGETPGPGAAWVNDRAGFLYRNGNDFISILGDDYALHFNPQLYLTYGRARRSGETTKTVWQYARGARFSGHITDHVFFESRLFEHVIVPVGDVERQGNTLPRRGLVTEFEDDRYNYFGATGMVGLRTKHFEVRFGRDRNRWGPGLGSVLLSNYASVYDQLQLRTTVWRLQYTNLFAGFTEPSLRAMRGNFAIPRKYGAFHRLAVELPGRVEVGLFESVIFATDTLGARQGFDISYANPIIFYRAVERDRGSPDNVLLGFDAAWQPLGGLRLYGQFMFDELKVDEIGEEWWANKWGWMLGLHAVDLPLPNLSVRAELARLRPFLYSHRTAATSYTHYNDLIGHPAGPNSRDLALFVDYRPLRRLALALNLALTKHGRNTATENHGGDATLSYNTRVADYGIEMFGGVEQDLLLVEARVGYEVLPELFVEAALLAESVDDAETGTDRYVAPFVMLRWGMPFFSERY